MKKETSFQEKRYQRVEEREKNAVRHSNQVDKKEQIDLRDQSVQTQKQFFHQLFGLTA